MLDKEQLFEVLKQRKLLNAYMNQMLVNQQEWLKEKENLYAQISAMEEEKKELIELFKQRINKVLEASAKIFRLQKQHELILSESSKFESKKRTTAQRVEADAQIIKMPRTAFI